MIEGEVADLRYALSSQGRIVAQMASDRLPCSDSAISPGRLQEICIKANRNHSARPVAQGLPARLRSWTKGWPPPASPAHADGLPLVPLTRGV